MITHYYLCYDESVDSLIERINTNRLIYNLEDNINAENDVFLIHAIIRININNGIYRKCELKQIIWNMLSDKCVVDKNFPFCTKIESYKSGFDNLFDYCWEQKFSFHKNGVGAKPLKQIVYTQMPLKRKLLDNNYSLIIGFIIFLLFVFMIDKWTVENCSWKWGGEKTDTHPIMATCLVLWISICVGSVGAKENVNKLAYGPPLIACIIFVLWSIIMILFEPYSMTVDTEWQLYEWSDSNLAILNIQLIKRNLYLGFSCLLLIPLFRLNIQRLNDFT